MQLSRLFLVLLTGVLLQSFTAPRAAMAQVAQWNQVVTDPKLQRAMNRAIREVANEYIDELDDAGLAGAIAFVDTQLDYPLQLASANFRHNNLNALQAKAGYVLRYEAKSSAGVFVQLGPTDAWVGLNGGYGGLPGLQGAGTSGGEIQADGAMMLCLVNEAGLEFMLGVISLASLDENGVFRVAQDGADIIRLHDEIVRRSYEYYGHTPSED